MMDHQWFTFDELESIAVLTWPYLLVLNSRLHVITLGQQVNDRAAHRCLGPASETGWEH